VKGSPQLFLTTLSTAYATVTCTPLLLAASSKCKCMQWSGIRLSDCPVSVKNFTHKKPSFWT